MVTKEDSPAPPLHPVLVSDPYQTTLLSLSCVKNGVLVETSKLTEHAND